uniref:Coiled-coil-helix-coiled-coil-helix domain containing 4b n=1 Tax=Neogobius melanostomus TaxID=47308 RepID=A0A8C6U511_9GOBI
MPIVREEDTIIFATKEDHEAPSNAELVEEDPNDPYEERGLILPSGEINWNCPCLGGMASGPCGSEFKEAFSCFHYSKEEVKGWNVSSSSGPCRSVCSATQSSTPGGRPGQAREDKRKWDKIYDVIVRLAPVEHGTESAAA